MIEPPNIIWISHLTRLFRCAPEHVRSVSSRELQESHEPVGQIPDITSGVVQFRQLTGQAGPSRPALIPEVSETFCSSRCLK